MEEQRYAAEHAHDHDDDVDSGVKKSPSEFSCGSADVYIPPSKHNHPGKTRSASASSPSAWWTVSEDLVLLTVEARKVCSPFFVIYVFFLMSWYTLGLTYNEFGYNENPGITIKKSVTEVVPSVKWTSTYYELISVHQTARCKRDPDPGLYHLRKKKKPPKFYK